MNSDNIINLDTENTVSQNSPAMPLVELFAKNTVLTQDDAKKLIDSYGFMVNTHQAVAMYRPLVVKLFGVLNSSEFPTTDSRYYQCKVEAEVHSNELIKDLHDFQLLNIKIEKAEYLLNNVMRPKFETCVDPISKKEIEFDIKEQNVIISNKKFDSILLQKKIKYRISEISEWKSISSQLEKAPDFKNKSHEHILLDMFKNSYSKKAMDPKTSEDEKLFIKNQLDVITHLENNAITSKT